MVQLDRAAGEVAFHSHLHDGRVGRQGGVDEPSRPLDRCGGVILAGRTRLDELPAAAIQSLTRL